MHEANLPFAEGWFDLSEDPVIFDQPDIHQDKKTTSAKKGLAKSSLA